MSMSPLSRIRHELWNRLPHNWRDPLADAGRWIARATSPPRIIEALKTLSWLAPLTLLIWIYAEREQIDSIDQSIPIEVRSDDPNRFVTLRMPDKNVVAQLSGPRARLEEIRRQVQPQGDRPSVIITIDPNLPPQDVHQLDTAQQLSRNPIFVRSGITVGNCKPARLPVYVDEFVERELDVQAPAGATNIVGAPIFDPRRVKVRAPKSYFAEAERLGPLVVEAELASTELLDKPGPHEASVPVSCPRLRQDRNVTYTPNKVTAAFEVRQADVKYTIPSMAVFVAGPQNLLSQYRVDCAPSVANVTVIGPPDKIELLQREDFPKPKAVLEVSGDDLPADVPRPPRRLIYRGLPEGVRVSPADEQRALEFTLVKLPSDQ